MSTQIEPTTKTAKLPVSYERAKAALDRCVKIDECQDWKNKAAALASYAKQADDESLFRMARRIQGRAVRRVGELLGEVKPAKNQHDAESRAGGKAPPGTESRKNAALVAGLSRDQQRQALRVASIPKRDFEKAIEAEKPPTLATLAKKGTKPSTAHLRGRKPEEFSASIDARGRMRDLAEVCKRVTPAVAVRGAADHNLPKMREWAKTILRWTTQVQGKLERRK